MDEWSTLLLKDDLEDAQTAGDDGGAEEEGQCHEQGPRVGVC